MITFGGYIKGTKIREELIVLAFLSATAEAGELKFVIQCAITAHA